MSRSDSGTGSSRDSGKLQAVRRKVSAAQLAVHHQLDWHLCGREHLMYPAIENHNHLNMVISDIVTPVGHGLGHRFSNRPNLHPTMCPQMAPNSHHHLHLALALVHTGIALTIECTRKRVSDGMRAFTPSTPPRDRLSARALASNPSTNRLRIDSSKGTEQKKKRVP